MEGKFFKMRSSFVRPADATNYTAGDEVANSATAESVVRLTYDLSGYTRGRILAAAMDITPASGNFINTASDLSILIFKTPDAPAAVGDNVALNIEGSVRAKSIGTWRFDDGAWTGQLGAVAGTVTSAFQQVPAQAVVPLATPALVSPHAVGHPFDFTGQTAAQRELTVVIQVLAGWDPDNVANTIGVTLDIEAE
jgi:hypothetical protein